jgi:RNA polymerase sigma-70 factor (ECF subfamily)
LAVNELSAFRSSAAIALFQHSGSMPIRSLTGRVPEARASYQKALALAQQEPERRFLSRRLEELK